MIVQCQTGATAQPQSHWSRVSRAPWPQKSSTDVEYRLFRAPSSTTLGPRETSHPCAPRRMVPWAATSSRAARRRAWHTPLAGVFFHATLRISCRAFPAVESCHAMPRAPCVPCWLDSRRMSQGTGVLDSRNGGCRTCGRRKAFRAQPRMSRRRTTYAPRSYRYCGHPRQRPHIRFSAPR